MESIKLYHNQKEEAPEFIPGDSNNERLHKITGINKAECNGYKYSWSTDMQGYVRGDKINNYGRIRS